MYNYEHTHCPKMFWHKYLMRLVCADLICLFGHFKPRPWWKHVNHTHNSTSHNTLYKKHSSALHIQRLNGDFFIREQTFVEFVQYLPYGDRTSLNQILKCMAMMLGTSSSLYTKYYHPFWLPYSAWDIKTDVILWSICTIFSRMCKQNNCCKIHTNLQIFIYDEPKLWRHLLLHTCKNRVGYTTCVERWRGNCRTCWGGREWEAGGGGGRGLLGEWLGEPACC